MWHRNVWYDTSLSNWAQLWLHETGIGMKMRILPKRPTWLKGFRSCENFLMNLSNSDVLNGGFRRESLGEPKSAAELRFLLRNSNLTMCRDFASNHSAWRTMFHDFHWATRSLGGIYILFFANLSTDLVIQIMARRCGNYHGPALPDFFFTSSTVRRCPGFCVVLY